MATHAITFGQRHAREEHPLGGWIHPGGWIAIDLPLDMPTVEKYAEVRKIFGEEWSMLYDSGEAGMDPSFFPRGQIGSVVDGAVVPI